MTRKPLIYESACIFSIVGSSIGFFMMSIATFFFKLVTERITMVTDLTATEKLSPIYFAILMSAFCVSLIGAIKLYQMRRTGLFFYLSAQLSILFFPVIWLGTNAFSLTNAVFTSLFIAVYLAHYRMLK